MSGHCWHGYKFDEHCEWCVMEKEHRDRYADIACEATDPKELEQMLLDPSYPKSELEHYAAKELSEARERFRALCEGLELNHIESLLRTGELTHIKFIGQLIAEAAKKGV